MVNILKYFFNKPSPPPSGAVNRLCRSARLGMNEFVTEVLDQCGAAVIDAENEWGWSALTCAAWAGQKDTVTLLLERGAAVDGKNPGCTSPLMAAAWGGYEDVVRLLLEKGADINAKDSSGRTALALAVDKGQKGTEALLLEKASSFNRTSGATARTLTKPE